MFDDGNKFTQLHAHVSHNSQSYHMYQCGGLHQHNDMWEARESKVNSATPDEQVPDGI